MKLLKACHQFFKKFEFCVLMGSFVFEMSFERELSQLCFLFNCFCNGREQGSGWAEKRLYFKFLFHFLVYKMTYKGGTVVISSGVIELRKFKTIWFNARFLIIHQFGFLRFLLFLSAKLISISTHSIWFLAISHSQDFEVCILILRPLPFLFVKKIRESPEIKAGDFWEENAGRVSAVAVTSVGNPG